MSKSHSGVNAIQSKSFTDLAGVELSCFAAMWLNVLEVVKPTSLFIICATCSFVVTPPSNML